MADRSNDSVAQGANEAEAPSETAAAHITAGAGTGADISDLTTDVGGRSDVGPPGASSAGMSGGQAGTANMGGAGVNSVMDGDLEGGSGDGRR